ncbi:MAG: class I SAM-dependent methyltransferase [Leptolyngbya sp. PLA2]|nr:class I SAM-dependent methyltransferase [Leptolyngbya sp.]MCE7971747.1 class I SAM-dependent methyltransferase [Leptolyngbya sp. PL-A2]MCZ7634387.1 class I SAM-dependent methyltransferase [Phycisphaerales bacterium]MDL1904815.1 class I SAM-dependent methyltransferase [Synechococcales cyanobacterium CNB]GIK19703.1 MAG: hypothetical protein BroJett004_18670 [Planctomycetota bacterium]
MTTATRTRPVVVDAGTPARDPTDFGLPHGYRQGVRNESLDHTGEYPDYWHPARLAMSGRYQRHVYRWAACLVLRRGLRSVLDVGCGPGTKLAEWIEPVCADAEGMDQPSAIEIARTRCRHARLHPVDLERPAIEARRTFDLILFVDVIEHLLDPDPALAMILAFAHPSSLVLVSTPDRDRVRGRACREAVKREHVREWSRREFLSFLRSRGLRPVRSRLVPQDDRPVRSCLRGEAAFRLHLADRSELRCHAVLCRVDAARRATAMNGGDHADRRDL